MTDIVYTKREQIARILAETLSGIKITDGYKNDFPEVKHWSTDIIQKKDEIFITVKDRIMSYADSADNNAESITVDVILGCSYTDDKYHLMANLIDDVKRCFWKNRLDLQNQLNLVDLKFNSDEINIQRFDYEVAAGRVSFTAITDQNCNWYYDDTQFQ